MYRVVNKDVFPLPYNNVNYSLAHYHSFRTTYVDEQELGIVEIVYQNRTARNKSLEKI